MLKRMLYSMLLLALVLPMLFAACEKDPEGFHEMVALDFSCDTMAFDTVFTQMGTTTRQFRVYNHNNYEVQIEQVTLERGYSSRFRLNVNGDTHMVARDLILAPGDSMFVFVRANINPNSATEPFLVEDAVIFRYDGQEQRLPLSAYGRNAVYHVPTDTLNYADGSFPLDIYGKPYAYSVIDCDHWRHDLPHVILGYAVIDSRNTLHLQAGDELYFCEDAVLWVYDSATLDVRGSAERPVLFTSVRHDGWNDYLPGQWGHIWMMQGCWNNHIDYALIENGFLGIEVDSCANDNPTLTISNTLIRNHTLAGLLMQTAHVEGNNLLVTNCGTATGVMQYGGQYTFSYCTFADYWNYSSRNNPSLFITNTREYAGILYVWPIQASLTDCIIYGNREAGELYLGLDSNAAVNVSLNHCLVRGGEWDEDPKFVDPANGDYHLEEDSPAQGIGYQYPEAVDVSKAGFAKMGRAPKNLGIQSSHRCLTLPRTTSLPPIRRK